MRHQARLWNITNSTSIDGGNAAAENIASNQTDSTINTLVTLTSTTVYEIQHRCATTRNGDGFGLASAFGSMEIYTSVTIMKVGIA